MPRTDRRSFLARTAGMSLPLFVTPAVLARVARDRGDLVRWLIETPHAKVLGGCARKLKSGTTQEELFAATFLASVEEVQPRPVGFKFHAVMVGAPLNHLCSQVPRSRRVVPLLWYVDEFKRSQARDENEGDWQLGAPPTRGLPTAEEAPRRLREALDRWDGDEAEKAATVVATTMSRDDAFEILWDLGARCWANIGHKGIWTTMAYRTLGTIGWKHATPVLRCLTRALLDDRIPRDSAPWPGSCELAKKHSGRRGGKRDDGVALEVMQQLRVGTTQEAQQVISKMLARPVDVRSLWDGCSMAAAEIATHSPDIVPLHAVTAINGLRFIASKATSEQARLRTLIQAAVWIPKYRRRVGRAGTPLDKLEGAPTPPVPGTTIARALADVGDRRFAVQRALSIIGNGDGEQFVTDATRNLVDKGADVHEFKFGVAILEDAMRVSAALRPRILATGMIHMPDPNRPDGASMRRVREAMG